MPTLNCCGSKHNAEENLQLSTNQPAEKGVLAPFSGKLSIDENLKLSHEEFKQTIYDFFKDKTVTPLSQLTATPTFPTPHVLAQFASKTYNDYKTRETDAVYGTRLALPDGWKLLTTASNNGKTNGYFGAAFWHPKHQQIVIAHRGTKFTNIGALWTDVVGVLCKHHAPQIESASTFAYKVVEVLQEVNQEKGTNFHMFFTGHSLGGWLAQITTFTTKYLKREGNTFLKNNSEQDCYHPHTVVFDSPGCKDMLSQMRDTFDVRLDGCSIVIEHLDITSYLSAPNRINTCNAHLGTVYRIFSDCSDMSWRMKYTALYNIAMHSMDKIVEAFDPETGQVPKDGQGQLKVQVVVDWPVSAGLRGGKEYKKFFEWAEHLNNYHPDVTDESFHYSPIRYQTKIYDKRVNSLSVFSQEEKEFLQCYLTLRQCPKSFKLKELFSVVKDSQAQEEAENILQSFEIEKDIIICTDANALQVLVPYVKRLLHLFPEIKEIGNRFNQCETNSCIEQINQSPLDFNPDALNVREFLEDEQQHVLQLQMVNGDEWTGLIKVYQVLQKTNCLIEGQYTVLKLERLLSLNMLVDFRTLMQSIKAPYLILVACEGNQLLKEETADMIRTFLGTMKQKPCIKIILTTGSKDRAAYFLQPIGRDMFGNGFVTRDEQLNWSDLTCTSQEKLLDKSVRFQGISVSLSKLMSAESPVAKFLPLGALLEDKELTISDAVPISNAYNESYYIGRTFCCQKAIKPEIFRDNDVNNKHVFLASTEQEMKKLCQLYPNSNVHWLENDKSGNLLWRQSQGNLETVRRYIDTGISHTYTADDLDKLLEQAKQQRVMLISDTAGMGKSTVLTHLCEHIKEKFPDKWVVRIDLNDHTDALKEKQNYKDKVIEFVSVKLLKLKTDLELELFKQCCEQKQKVGIVIMLDGFDEISPFYKETVTDLLQALRQTAVEQLWVTTRPQLRNELEDKLQQLSYTLEPFSEPNQVEFLTRFWNVKDWFTEMDSEEAEKAKNKLEIFAKQLIKKLAHSISDKDKELTGIPLQCRMLAEAFDEGIETHCHSSVSMPEVLLKLDLVELYERFFNRKYDIWLQEKVKTSKTNVGAMEARKLMVQTIKENHLILALNLLFTKEQVDLLKINGRCTFSDEELTRIGIIQNNCEGKLHFIHRTFAEYCVAEFLVQELKEGMKHYGKVKHFLLTHIFLEEGYAVIRKFIDVLLSRSKPSIEALRQFGCQVNHIPTVSVSIMQRAQSELNVHIIELLIISLHTGKHSEKLNELLLALDIRELFCSRAIGESEIEALKEIWKIYKENLTREQLISVVLPENGSECYGLTLLHSVAQTNKPEVLELVWEWAKEELSPEELKHKFLLTENGKANSAWHVAAMFSNPKSLEKLWDWAKEILMPEELKNGMLLAKTSFRKTAFYEAAEMGVTAVLKVILECAKKDLTPDEFRNEFLLAGDEQGRTAFYTAAAQRKAESLDKYWAWAKKDLPTEDLRNMFLATDRIRRRRAWDFAAVQNNTKLLQKIWGCAEEVVTAEVLKHELLLAKDDTEQTALPSTAVWGNTESLQVIWEWAKKELSSEDLKKMFLGTERCGRTAWHAAAMWNNTETLQKIWDWAEEVLTPGELRSQLLAKDILGQTALHAATERYSSHSVQKMLEWARDILDPKEIKNDLLLAKDNCESTVWHLAADCDNAESLQTIWEWAKVALTSEELKNQLLLAKDNRKRTVWHIAVDCGHTDSLQTIWEWAKQELTTEELKNILLLAKDVSGQTALHAVVKHHYSLSVLNILKWAEDVLDTEEFNNILLLAKDRWGTTARHSARTDSNIRFLLVCMQKWGYYPVGLLEEITCTTQQGGTMESHHRNYGIGLKKH